MCTFTSGLGGSPRILVAWLSPAMCKTKQVQGETVSVIEHLRIIYAAERRIDAYRPPDIVSGC